MEKAKKKRLKRYISWGCLALVVLSLAVLPLMAGDDAAVEEHPASILSGTVQTGSISVSLHGGGTLTAGDAQEVTLPTDVKITEFLVRNGDTVAEGDALATVDKVSVMSAIMEVQETLEYLQDEMAEVKNETVSSTVSASAGGRVKQVYASAGDSVQQVMLQHGALAVLSLDGLMAVELSGTGAAAGDAVEVTLADGAVVEGRVESSLDGRIVVTVEDEGYAIGQSVTVTKDGTDLGAGALYVHSAWSATAVTGTISSVYIDEEDTVSAGSSLFRLTDTEYTAQLQRLSTQHRQYEELMQELFQMYQSGVITAPCDGTVSGVDKDSPHLLSAVTQEQTFTVQPLTAQSGSGSGIRLVLLSDTGGGDDANSEVVPDENGPSGDGSSQDPGAPSDPTEPSQPEQTTYYGYAVQITTAGNDGIFYGSVNSIRYPVTRVDAEDGSYTWNIDEVDTDTEHMANHDQQLPISGAYSKGDILVIIVDSNDQYVDTYLHYDAPEETPPDETVSEETQPDGSTPTMPEGMEGLEGMGDLSGMLGGMSGMSGMSGITGGAATQEPEYELYDLEGSTLMTVTDQGAMTLSITVDEQDISKLSVGQTATVQVEALRGQSFEATVTRIGNSGANNGGSSKFTVELTMDIAENMLSGMSATATIGLYTQMDILTIPTAALAEDGAATVVYTALDQDSGQPTAPVEVQTGISDGETVQIVSGLSSGDSFYYSYYDTLELDTSVEPAGFSFGG